LTPRRPGGGRPGPGTTAREGCGADEPTMREDDLVQFACPDCDDEFESVWDVTVDDSGEYPPVFGGPVTLEIGRCNNGNNSFERVDGGPWRRQGVR
jgi:hypothetical protein